MMVLNVFKMKYRADILVIAGILILALSLLAFSVLTREEGAVAVVEIDGVKVGEYSLSVDGTYPLNGGTNVLVIENGVAYLNYSNCPDHTCENTGKIHYVGQTIICLPNLLSITITGDATSDGVDFVS
jgi:hypothetical protein